MRLNKFLSSAGVCSRRKADELIEGGKVIVNGKVAEVGCQIDEKRDVVTLEGKEVKLPLERVYIMLNKPKGYACSANDEKGRKTIYDLVDLDVRLFSIGRLDYDTEGLILLTNDGEFAERVAHPSFEIEKAYIVKIEGKILESELAVLRKGVVENGVRMPRASVKVTSIEKDRTRLSVVIHEGQNHQVRRMFDAIGKSIILLKRVRIGDVKLGGLKRGEWRPLKPSELAALTEGR